MNMVDGIRVIQLSHLPPHIFSFAGKDPLKCALSDRKSPLESGINLMETRSLMNSR